MTVKSAEAFKVRKKRIDVIEYERLFREHYKSLCRYAYSFVNNQGIAEIVVQQMFLLMWEKRKSYEVLEDTRFFLYRATYLACLFELKEQRKRDLVSRIGRPIGAANVDLGLFISNKALYAKIYKILGTLSPNCRAVVDYHRMHKLNFTELSFQMNMSTAGIEICLGKAFEALRKGLKGELKKALQTEVGDSIYIDGMNQAIPVFLCGEADPPRALMIDKWRSVRKENDDLMKEYEIIHSLLYSGELFQTPNSTGAWLKIEKKKHTKVILEPVWNKNTFYPLVAISAFVIVLFLIVFQLIW